jgi:DNA-binding response OmpR family regulator
MEPLTAITTPSPNPNGKRILCIEDEHFISELYVRALSKAGYEVTVEVDGARGLVLAQSDRYDIILLDLMIPTMTGTEVLRKLRDPALTTRLHSKVIITTNLEQREDIRADIERQADGYIIKAAITPRELVDTINHIKL